MAGHDNLEEFADPENYDLEQTARSQRRVAWHVQLACAVGGPVLELACGTGIVAIPLAQAGLAVTGVDIVPAMLEAARRKSLALGLEVDWHCADVKGLDLGRRFRLVVLTGHGFQAFLARADQDALFATVARHLAPGGRFVFDTRNPPAHDLDTVVDDEFEAEYVDIEGRPVRVSYSQRYDPGTQVMHWTTHRRRDGARRDTRIDCRFSGAAELDALLRAHGFEIVARHGDWDGSPVGDASEELITVCRPAASARSPS
jgi:SAM-dependent methyltransferase